jgi:glycosyltransferase involved in cell wall biosynthesis
LVDELSATQLPQVPAEQKIVIDITRLVGRYLDARLPTGVDRVSLSYVEHFRDQLRVIVRWRGLSGLFSKKISQDVAALLVLWDFAELTQMKRLLFQGALSNLSSLNANGAFLLHTGHNDAESSALWRDIRWRKLRPIFFVHDLIPLSYPQFCRDGEGLRHEQRIRYMLQGEALVANSAATLNALKQHAEKHTSIVPSSTVAFLAPYHFQARDDVQSGIPDQPLAVAQSIHNSRPHPYFVILGTIEPRKNHALLLKVWEALLAQFPEDVVPDLVVIGQSGWHSEDIELQLRDTATYKGRVHWMQKCSDSEMQVLISRARALLFPSFVEGFGMPMVEALTVGTPVIASDLPVYKEFAYEVPEYLQPDDVASWIKFIMAYAQDGNSLREAQCHRIKAWVAPTWQAHFNKVNALLDALNQPVQAQTQSRLSQLMPTTGHRYTTKRFSWRKRHILDSYLRAMTVDHLPHSYTWGAVRLTVDTICVEDGFIRSVGLGADLTKPLSWVFDTRGMYFDATQTSDLEHLLQHQNYTDPQLQRAESLRQMVVLSGATKYNLHAPTWVRPPAQPHVILVVGQVESDASIRLGTHLTRTNQQLLQAARLANPQAYIVYKPHPDVVAGLRSGGDVKQPLANEVLLVADMAQLLSAVDEVHVMTSLTGFEALLRGVPVTTYGAPFYAGWGLTKDMDLPEAVKQRRTRRLDLNHLVAATLIDYPVYLHPQNNRLITPEQALQVVQAQRWRVQDHVKNPLPTMVRRGILRAVAKIRNRY